MIDAIQPNLPFFLFLMVGHCIIGTAAAFLAKRKGYDFSLWLILGLIGGSLAFVTAWFLKGKEDPANRG